jgi:WD40 repeat protein
MTGHEGQVSAPAIEELDGRPIAVTGGEDGSVRVWDLTTQRPIGTPMTGHTRWVSTPAVGEFITGQEDEGPVWVEAILERLAFAPEIRSLTLTETPAGWLAVLGTNDGGVSTVDLATGTLLLQVRGVGGSAMTAITCNQIAGRPVAILASDSGAIQIRDLLSGEAIEPGHIDDPLLNVQPQASALVVTRGSLMKVWGRADGTIVLEHDATTGLLPGQHDGAVTAIACAYLNDRPVVFTGGEDGTVRIWDLLDARLLDVIDIAGPVFAIRATNYGDLLIGADGEVIAFRHASASSRPPGDPA